MDNQEDKSQAGLGNVQTNPAESTAVPLPGFQETQPTNPASNNLNQINNQPNPPEPIGATASEPSIIGQELGDQQSNVIFDSYTSDADNSADKKDDQSSHTDHSSADEKGSRMGTIITIILIVIIAVGIWQTNKDNKGQTGDDDNNVTVVVDSTKETGNVTIIGGDKIEDKNSNISGETVKIIAYYNKRGTNECENVSPLERTVEKKYDSDVINTVRGLLTPLSENEMSADWLTSIPDNTYLKNVIIKDGTAQVVFSSALKNMAGSCRVLAIRSQIEKTLLQFSYIKSVKICIDNNCQQDEILQP